jgi:hypothetical protein
MRKVFLMFLVLNASIWAQSVVPQAPQETLNLAPRCQRGEAQTYRMQVEVIFSNDDGKPMAVKNNRIDYTQLCVANNPDSGLIYEVTIDSFVIGTVKDISELDRESFSLIDSLSGLHFRSQYRSKIPIKGDCYDFGIPLTTGFPYLEAWEFIDDFLPAKIIEQLHYTVGRRLSKVGDTATIAWPKPICYDVQKIIEKSSVDQKPFKLTLTGLSSYRGTPCATVSIASAISPYRVDMYTPDTSSFKALGTSQITGEFQVSLKNGNIVHAKMSERLETSITETNVPVRKNSVVKNTELIPRVW